MTNPMYEMKHLRGGSVFQRVRVYNGHEDQHGCRQQAYRRAGVQAAGMQAGHCNGVSHAYCTAALLLRSPCLFLEEN